MTSAERVVWRLRIVTGGHGEASLTIIAGPGARGVACHGVDLLSFPAGFTDDAAVLPLKSPVEVVVVATVVVVAAKGGVVVSAAGVAVAGDGP